MFGRDSGGGMSLGVQNMLKSMGFDPEEMKRVATLFMDGQRALLESIDANQKRIEAKIDGVSSRLQFVIDQQTRAYLPGSTTELKDSDGRGLGVVVTDEKFSQVILDDATKASSPPDH
jgi:hypothetical protein